MIDDPMSSAQDLPFVNASSIGVVGCSGQSLSEASAEAAEASEVVMATAEAVAR